MPYSVAAYNVGPAGDPGRTNAVLEAEIRALCGVRRFRRPLREVVGLFETIGWGELPQIKGMTLIRDTSTPGRANISAYVRNDIRVHDVTWHRCRVTWKRTEHPGQHDPREVLELHLDEDQFLIAHEPPLTRHNDSGPARTEHEAVLLRRMAPWTRSGWGLRTAESRATAKARLRVLLWDPNSAAPSFAARVGGVAAGTSIEGALVVGGGKFLNARVVHDIDGVRMASDHKRAFLAEVVAK